MNQIHTDAQEGPGAPVIGRGTDTGVARAFHVQTVVHRPYVDVRTLFEHGGHRYLQAATLAAADELGPHGPVNVLSRVRSTFRRDRFTVPFSWTAPDDDHPLAGVMASICLAQCDHDRASTGLGLSAEHEGDAAGTAAVKRAMEAFATSIVEQVEQPTETLRLATIRGRRW